MSEPRPVASGPQAATSDESAAGEGFAEAERRPIGLWLMPVAEHHGPWAELIRQLAVINASPVFEPHVSLQAGQAVQGIDPVAQLDQIAARCPVIELPVLGLGHGAAFFKSVFVRLPSTPVRALSAELGTLMADPQSFVLDAHLSLVYADLAEAARRSLCASLTLPGTGIRFDRVAVVEPGAGERDFARVDRWRITASVVLLPGPV